MVRQMIPQFFIIPVIQSFGFDHTNNFIKSKINKLLNSISATYTFFLKILQIVK